MIRAGDGRPNDFGESIQPCVLLSELASGEVVVSGRRLEVPSAVAELGRFGVDAAESGVGPAVLGIPFLALVHVEAELIEVPLGTGDVGFGPVVIVGEAVDLVQDRCFLVAAVAAELGERTEFAQSLLGGFEAVIGPDHADEFDNAVDELGKWVDHLRQAGIRGFIAEHTWDDDFTESQLAIEVEDEMAPDGTADETGSGGRRRRGREEQG